MPESTAEVATAFDVSRHHIVKGAGHLPQVEKADEFLALFRAFASQLPR